MFVVDDNFNFYFFHTEAVQNASGPLLVEIDKSPGCSLGITLTTTTFRGKTVMCIDTIRAASIADR